jgi:hypothetical protein
VITHRLKLLPFMCLVILVLFSGIFSIFTDMNLLRDIMGISSLLAIIFVPFARLMSENPFPNSQAYSYKYDNQSTYKENFNISKPTNNHDSKTNKTNNGTYIDISLFFPYILILASSHIVRLYRRRKYAVNQKRT